MQRNRKNHPRRGMFNVQREREGSQFEREDVSGMDLPRMQRHGKKVSSVAFETYSILNTTCHVANIA
jgi:hypothetical protein